MSLRLDSHQEWNRLLQGSLLRDPARRDSSHLSQRSLPCADRTHTHLITGEIYGELTDVKRHSALCPLFCSRCTDHIRQACYGEVSDIMTRLSIPHRHQANKHLFTR